MFDPRQFRRGFGGIRATGRDGARPRIRAARLLGLALALVATVAVVPLGGQAAQAAVLAHQRIIVTGSSATSAATFSVTIPAGTNTVAGRHLVVGYLFSGTGGDSVTSVTDSRGNSYRTDAVKSNSGSSGLKAYLFSAKLTTALVAGDTLTVTQSTSTTYHAIQVHEFDNFDPTSWADRSAVGNASSASTSVTTAATATTSAAAETLVAVAGMGDTPTTLTSDAGWTDAGAVTAGGSSKQKTLAMAAREVTSTGSYAYSGTLSTADQSVALLATYRTVATQTTLTASFSAAPTSGYAPLAVQFTDTSAGGPTGWSWTFGDGGTSTAQNPAHTYQSPGTYSVTLTVTNSVGSDTVTQSNLITANSGAIGYQDMSTQGTGNAATGEKPESKLWFNDGSWWADLFDSTSLTYHIFRLDRAQQTWTDTGVVVDNRANTRSDTLWDGSHLYIASHVFASSSASAASGNPARLYRFSYDPSGHTYTLDSGFPVAISNYSSETLTIDRDSTGRLWASWAQASQVYVNSTTGSDTAWGTPAALSVTGASGLSSDDITAVVAFGHSIGVMWSNQVTSAIYFAEHADADPAGTWDLSRTAVQGPGSADDHINLKTLQGDPAGHVFAAVKTSLDDAGASQSAPQILVLARDPATGDWSSAPFGRISDCHTRPIIMLDSQHQVLHVFATAPDSGCPYSGYPGTIFEKTSPMSAMSFPLGRGTPVIRDVASPNLNNTTSTKQSVTDATGLIIMASNDATKRYWHADIPLQ
jgi:PKD repeat protein